VIPVLFTTLGVIGVAYLTAWVRDLSGGGGRPRAELPEPREAAIGFGTNFFDTLGIGSYAPTTVLFRFFRLVPDERIPGTLTIGHTLPTMAQAFIYISIIEVEMRTLVLLILAAVVGSWLGAGVVSRWPRRKIQVDHSPTAALARRQSPPVQLVSELRFIVRPSRVLFDAPGGCNPAVKPPLTWKEAFVANVSVIVPPFHSMAPVTVTSSDPVSVPPDCV